MMPELSPDSLIAVHLRKVVENRAFGTYTVGLPSRMPPAAVAAYNSAREAFARGERRPVGKPVVSSRSTAELRERLDADKLRSERNGSDRWRKSLHEAGHAITAAALGYYSNVREIALSQSEDVGGYCMIADWSSLPCSALAAIFFAGDAALVACGFESDREMSRVDRDLFLSHAAHGCSTEKTENLRSYGTAMAAFHCDKHRGAIEVLAARLSTHNALQPNDWADIAEALQ